MKFLQVQVAEGVLARDRRRMFQSLSRPQKGSLPWVGRRGPCLGPTTNVSKCLLTAEGVLARDQRRMFPSVSRPQKGSLPWLGRQKGSLPGTNDKCFKSLKTAEGVLARDRRQILYKSQTAEGVLAEVPRKCETWHRSLCLVDVALGARVAT